MTLELIGQKLKAARESQGLSLRQIYERTKIPINHLQSIDTGQPEDLPEPVYVAGFIKRYAECIGLDGQVLADEYRREDTDNNGNGNGKPRHGASQQVYVTPEYLKHTRIDQSPPSWKLWPFYAFIILVVIAVVSYFSNHTPVLQSDPNVLSLKDAASKLQAQNQGITAPTPAATATDTSATAQTGTTTATPDTGNDKVVLTVQHHVWVEVKKLGSGDALFTGNLEAGQTREFQDSQGLRIRAGDGGNLSVEFKGKIEPFGHPGKVSERTFDTHNAEAATSTSNTSDQASSTAALTSGSTSQAAASKLKKVTKKVADSSSAQTAHRHRRSDEEGSRSIPGESGEGGARTIDVPYRYSEGRLDAN